MAVLESTLGRLAGTARWSARLRGNPELQSGAVRLLTALFGAGYIALGAWADYYRVDVPYFLTIFALHLLASFALIVSVIYRPDWVARRYLAICLDVVVVSLAIFVTQEAISPFYLLYILIFISAGTRFGRGPLIVGSVVAVLAYNLVLIELDEWHRHTFEAAFFLLLLVLLPLYQASLLRQLQQARADAERASKAKSDFLAIMTHELRTPLTGVIGMAELLRETRLDSEQCEQVEAIASSANALSALIGDILDFSKLDARRLKLERLPFAPRELTHEVCAILDGQACARGLALIQEIAPEVPERVLGDALRVRQILFNLIGNAIKFTEHGEVRVRLRVAESSPALGRPHLAIEVIDTGIGIPADTLDVLFESFRQADDSTTRRFGGTGLGTTIARELVVLMGGAIEVESEEGRGSLFRVRLPLLDELPPAVAEEPACYTVKTTPNDWRTPHAGPAIRVLVAEDNAIAAKVITRFLDRMGFEYDLFTDGASALEAALAGGYQIAVVDLRMPKLDGLDFTRRYRAESNGRPLPILALTANASEDVRHDCLDAGMDGFLAKPVKPDELRSTIEHFGILSDTGTSNSPRPIHGRVGLLEQT
ncbi:ATP-binding protein [Allochromatium palmeri]|uniref:histidine kinase n=1 Tax=Allochromatium palmeri TaxID=231048 RepID=A0A6N8EIU4_9GAMM|nr:ATP-binding protein [Allochromatium palmeri]MTW22958.1 response regulator [Allochromatium palmeri]